MNSLKILLISLHLVSFFDKIISHRKISEEAFKSCSSEVISDSDSFECPKYKCKSCPNGFKYELDENNCPTCNCIGSVKYFGFF
jgi:hypothetical protein